MIPTAAQCYLLVNHGVDRGTAVDGAGRTAASRCQRSTSAKARESDPNAAKWRRLRWRV